MRKNLRLSSAAVLAFLLAAVLLQPAWIVGQVSGFAAPAAFDLGSERSGSPDGMIFAEGTRAINEGRWADAMAIFSKIAEKKSDHADGALYWKAYAQDKLGQAGPALESCAALRAAYPKSSWLDECGALEIDIHARSGQPVRPQPEQSDDLRLLALNSMMQHDEAKARAEIEEILNDEDASDRLKNGALFLLGQHRSDLTFPEIVRVSYVEGDVRIERGGRNGKALGGVWEKAETDTPIESGFSLVTGAGRAEIEFEDASTIYLDENSVLTFNDLHTTDNIPYTEIALLSGTATTHVKPYVTGEVFLLKTPTDDNLLVTYPVTSYLRVTIYLDATAITPLEGGVLHLKGGSQQAALGQTMYFRTQHRLDAPDGSAPQSFEGWDRWVADRVEARAKATAETMQAAGLNSPLPGLAEMQGQGKFFDCAPYGTCWEPTAAEEWEREHGEDAEAAPVGDMAREEIASARSGSAQAQAMAARVQAVGGGNAKALAAPGTRRLEDYDFFPCLPDSFRFQWSPAHTADASQQGNNPFAYRWTVCHSGYWIRHRRHYAWVVGKRHHHPPVRWVKQGRTVGFVPIHPRDVKGEPPVNGKDRLFPVNLKTGISEGPIRVASERPVAVMKEAPKEFRSPQTPELARAEEPQMVAHSFRGNAGNKPGEKPGIPISYDRKSGNFTMPQHVMQGGKQVTVNSPISNHSGNLQSHAGGIAGSGGSHGGGSSSAGSGGGGSHSGGGSSAASSSGSTSAGGGGGSHH